LKTTTKKLGDQYIVGPPTKKLGDQSSPVATVVAPMPLVTPLDVRTLQRPSVIMFYRLITTVQCAVQQVDRACPISLVDVIVVYAPLSLQYRWPMWNMRCRISCQQMKRRHNLQVSSQFNKQSIHIAKKIAYSLMLVIISVATPRTMHLIGPPERVSVLRLNLTQNWKV